MEEKTLTTIFDLIPSGSKVLDLGCGDGELLQSLKNKKNVTCYGIEINFDHILACVSKGIPVFQGDIDEGLTEFPDKSYDYVILSLTLQQARNPLLVLKEMLRVGKKAIVTFPNFGYWQVRLDVLTGVAPRTKTLPYPWFETPNIRVVSIKDFKQLCKNEHIKITKELPYDVSNLVLSLGLSNLLSRKGIFVIEQANS